MGFTNVQDGRDGCLTPLRKLPVGDHADFFAASLHRGLGGVSQIADQSGGECFSLGTSQLVSFQPYLDNLQKMLSHQCYVVFEAVPRKKAGFQRINIQTELSNSELEAPDNVWVRGAGK